MCAIEGAVARERSRDEVPAKSLAKGVCERGGRDAYIALLRTENSQVESSTMPVYVAPAEGAVAGERSRDKVPAKLLAKGVRERGGGDAASRIRLVGNRLSV